METCHFIGVNLLSISDEIKSVLLLGKVSKLLQQQSFCVNQGETVLFGVFLINKVAGSYG